MLRLEEPENPGGFLPNHPPRNLTIAATGASGAIFLRQLLLTVEGDQRIETRTLDDPVPSMDVGMAWRRDADQSPAVHAFRDFLGLSFNGGGPGMTN